MARLRTVTLGCKVNQYETQWVREGLHAAGFVDAQDHEPAELCVVNTCTVTHEGDAKSRQIIRRLHRDNPDARIVVMGCYATRAPEEIAALPGVAEVVTDKRTIPDWLGRFGVVDVPQGITGFAGHARAWVKVQDGCLLSCRYCIIPTVRPVMSSRPADAVCEEVRGLIERGCREIVLTGVHLGHYGVDFNRGLPKDRWTRLSHLVRRLADLDGDFRIRLSSIEATEVTRELITALEQAGDRIAPHLHLCLQSGSDAVLRRMRRRWGVKRFLDVCDRVRERLDRPALTTDIIVGFPGETEAEFEQTLSACEAAGFSKIHAFPFSARRGTPAALDSDQVAPEVRSARMERLGQLEEELRNRYLTSLLGSTTRVLIEDVASLDSDLRQGTGDRYETVRFTVPAKSGDRHHGATEFRVGQWALARLDHLDPHDPRLIRGSLVHHRLG